jgi:hypothetical protein
VTTAEQVAALRRLQAQVADWPQVARGRRPKDPRLLQEMVIELHRQTDELLPVLLDGWDAKERYMPIIAALGIYGEAANLPALVEKVRSFPEIKRTENELAAEAQP